MFSEWVETVESRLTAPLDDFISSPSASLADLQKQEAGLDVRLEDAVPHDARGAAREGMLEFDHLAGMQAAMIVRGAEAAPAVVYQVTPQHAMHGVGETQCDAAGGGVALLDAAIGPFKRRRIDALIPFHRVSTFG
jgi:hypothetical protein